jgi:hypothetical protein
MEKSAIQQMKQRLGAALKEVMAEEQAATEQRLSVPVGRGPGGFVTVRSKPGESPRLETGELHGNVESFVELHETHIEGTLRVSRPGTPEVPRMLQDQMNRPITIESELDLAHHGAGRIAAKFRGI